MSTQQWPDVIERQAICLSSEQAKLLLFERRWVRRRSWEYDERWVDPLDGSRHDFGEALRRQLAREPR